MRTPMSEDEVGVLVVSVAIGAIVWGRWYWHLLRFRSLGRGVVERCLLLVLPLACAGLLFGILRLFASHDVRDDPRYLLLYVVFGAAWVGLFTLGARWMGISARDDVIERRNPAAAVAIGASLVALTLCFAGANIGDGPGWWVVVFSAFLPTVVLFAMWFEMEQLGDVTESITVDRDLATGLRFGGFLVAAGLILGRSAAGDWRSAGETVVEFVRLGWPSLALWAVAALVERACRPSDRSADRAVVSCGLIPAASYVFGAVMYVWRLGAWE